MNEPSGTIQRRDLLARTYRLYHARWRMLFRMGLPPAIVAYFVIYLVREIARSAPWFGPASQRTAGFWLYVTGVGLVESCSYWLISAFFFAGVAASLLAEAGDENSLIGDAFSRARRRIGPVFAVAFLAWALFVIGRTITALVLFPLLQKIPIRPGAIWLDLVVDGLLLVVAGLVSRLGVAIPVLMHDPGISTRQALRVSMKTTEEWEPFFMLFLIKTAILGYAAYWLGSQALQWLWHHGILSYATYPWAVRLEYVAIAALLESPLFIAFSLLYRESQLRQETTMAAAVE